MMKLDRLEVAGFKSFVDPVSLQFSDGITGIVGPNGCGKSNLSEAITWALGEQSAKSLRGGSMEDVIFNGADNRRPLGLAEVSLSLLTDPDFPGAEDGRLTLSRRVFRNGESQYRLNGKLVRLKDFRDLLMDTGLGLRAYSVIEQGKIGLILSGKPQERRKLIEEAAGVTRYKARKKVAEVKLEEATANLLRLNDIVAEIERNLRSLKRQAGAAKRYQEKHSELRSLLRRVLDGRWAALAGRADTVRTEVEAEEARELELAADLNRVDSELSREREDLDRFSDALSAKHRTHAETVALIEGRQSLIRGGHQTLDEIARQVTAGEASARNREADLGEAQAALAGLASRRGDLASARAASAATVEDDDRRIAAIEGETRSAESALEELRARLLASLNEVTHLRNHLHREQIQAEKGSYQKSRLGDQLSLWTAHIEEADALLSAARSTVERLAARVEAAEAQLALAEANLTSAQRRVVVERDRAQALENEIQTSNQRRHVLEELAAAHSERQQAWRAALAAAGIDSPSFLGERLQAPAGFERSVDLFLGDVEDALVLDTPEAGLELANRLSATGIAGRLVVPRDPRDLHNSNLETLEPLSDPAILGSLAASLGLSQGLADALPPAYLVATREDAVRLARRFPAAAFLSRDRSWAQGGLLHVQGEKAQPGRLARLREASDLAERIPGLETDRREILAALERADAEVSELETLVGRLRRDLAAAREEAAAEGAKLGTIESRHQRLAVEHATLSTERDEVERELSRVAEREQNLQAELERTEARHAETERAFDERQLAVSDLRSRREALRTESAGRRGQLDLITERLASHDREVARLDRQAEDAQRQLQAWAEQSSRMAERRGELESSIARAEDELQGGLVLQAKLDEELHAEQETLEERRTGLRDLDERVHGVRADRDVVRGRLEDARIRRASLRQEAEHLATQYREEFHHEPPAAEDLPAIEVDALAELEADLARLKDQIERIGPVNVLAADEYTEQEQRNEFLVTQRADVAQSVESLKNTIREINLASSERFLETFQQVNVSFGQIFQALFRGGEAEMRLMDEDDLLESGIEIVARPPGKRLQNLMLLSGGEKALTAIALLFALFRTKPSPFCILDEVDAPLDDINTLRFVEVLKQMAGDTQFLVVTHNKLTMEVASRLYGVTMEERGVSKLVTVAMEQLEAETAATA